MPNLYLAKCCAIPAGCFNPWIKGVSCDGYDCNPPKGDRVTLSIGTDFGLTTYASFDDGSPGADPCMFNGIQPWDRDLADTNPTAIFYTGACNQYPAGINYCCCGTNSLCTPSQGGTQCEWFANDNKYPGSWFTDFNLLCTKDGIAIASQTVEEDNYIACCGGYFGELNCGQVACGCDQLYGDTLCNRSTIAHTFGDPCASGGPCPPYVGYQYFTDDPVLTTYYGFDDAVNAGVISASDPVGVFQTALTFNSLTGDTFTGGVLLNDHIVDPNDIITWPGILSGYFGSPPDLDTAFPIGVYSPNGIQPGGNPPWVTITLTMTSGPYNGITYTYNYYGTAEQFAAWALLNWDPVSTGRIEIIGSPDYWMGLRVPPDALNTVTGQYIPVHEYRRIMTRPMPLGGYMPDNSDDFELFSATPTNIVWKARLRQFYTWRVFTTMQDVRVHGMSLEALRVVTGTCCSFDHCTQTRIWWGVTGADPAVAPCTVINPLVDTSGSCGAEGAPYNTHTDTCESSNCAAVQQSIGYDGYCTGYTQSTCFPSQYNVDMSYSYTQDPNYFDCSNSYCINLPP